MSGIEIIAVVAITAGLFGFLGFLAFIAHTNNSKNLKNDYLVIESRSSCRTNTGLECCETIKVNDGEQKKTGVSKIVRVNGIGKDLRDKEGQ